MEEFEAGGFDGGDDEARGFGGDLPEGGGAGLLDFGVGREVFKGEDVVGGEADDGGGVECAGEVAGGEDGLVEGFGGLVIGDEDEGGGGGGLDEVGEVEGSAGEGEAGDAATGVALLEVAAGAVEGVGVFEVGEQVADEGEDHWYSQFISAQELCRYGSAFACQTRLIECLMRRFEIRANFCRLHPIAAFVQSNCAGQSLWMLRMSLPI